MLHNPAQEARRWKATGQINQARVQWVAGNLRPMKKALRARQCDEIRAIKWASLTRSVGQGTDIPAGLALQ